jgi:leucine dehydrogenase
MDELLRKWDGECAVVRYDAPSGAWIFIAIHDRRHGMSLGGCRMTVYPSPSDGLRDALRLARGMTLKWAALGFPFGGGKAVLAPPRPLEGAEREGLLLRFGDLIEMLAGSYGTGVDLGTTPEDMDVIATRTRRVFGRSAAQGGTGDPGPWTALGVTAGMEAACEYAFGSPELEGRVVLIQGLGSVGRPLARRLAGTGAVLLLTDAIPSRAAELAAELDAEVVPPVEAYHTPCDIFAPCAIGGILNERSIPRLRCRIVAGSANNQIEVAEDAIRLHERGILYAPDFIINAGGAVAMSALELLGWSEDAVRERVIGVGSTLQEIFADAGRRAEAPLVEALARAERAIEAPVPE